MLTLRKSLFMALLLAIGINLSAQKVAVKTNILYWGTTTANVELEFATGKKTTVAVLGVYNPWTFKNDKMMHTGGLQPQFKYWFCERFEGHFVGVHGHWAEYFGGFNKHRYDGHLVGAGISYGYDWILSNHWNMEAEVGFGVNYTWYKKSDCLPCMKGYVKQDKTFFSPTRLSLSLIYLF